MYKYTSEDGDTVIESENCIQLLQDIQEDVGSDVMVDNISDVAGKLWVYGTDVSNTDEVWHEEAIGSIEYVEKDED